MYDCLNQFTITPSRTMMDALCKINKNKRGFLIVVDLENYFLGTLTDGDIRRALLQGKVLDETVDNISTKICKKLNETDSIGTAIDLFKNESIKFLPVISSSGQLRNIITKKQLHALLLKDIHADLCYDFALLDENIIDYEIFQRPWGFYKTTVMNDYYQSKIICVYPKEQLSLQSHDRREEHWIIAHGTGIVQIGKSYIDAKCGDSIFIPRGCKHRLMNTDEKESLVITEVQIGDYFGEDDIHRYEDIYGRI